MFTTFFQEGAKSFFKGALCTPSDGPGEMAPMAKLKCASLLIIYVSQIGKIFMKVKPSRKSISAPMPQPLAAYMWPEALQVKDLNLEAIRQALLRADDVNLRIVGPPHRITVRYEDLTAADDGNQDKAAIVMLVICLGI